MPTKRRKVDHIVYGVHDLDKSIQTFAEKYGMQATVGGQHLHQGTKNALINLGEQCYLELLAVDKQNVSVTKNRWMGIDLLTSEKMIRWALHSDNLSEDRCILEKYNDQLGQVKTGMRQRPNKGDLSWKLTMPLSTPEVEVVPFLIDWSESSAHPTDAMSQQGQLLEIKLFHPDPNSILNCLKDLQIDVHIYKSQEARISAVIQGPNEIFEI